MFQVYNSFYFQKHLGPGEGEDDVLLHLTALSHAQVVLVKRRDQSGEISAVDVPEAGAQ